MELIIEQSAQDAVEAVVTLWSVLEDIGK